MSDEKNTLDPIFEIQTPKGKRVFDLDKKDKDLYRSTMAIYNSGSTHSDRVKFANNVLNYYKSFTNAQAKITKVIVGDSAKTITANLGDLIALAKTWQVMKMSIVTAGNKGGNKNSPSEIVPVETADLF